MTVKRIRRAFGAPVKFSDRNTGDAKDAVIECTPYPDQSFDLKKIELDTGIQVRSGIFIIFWYKKESDGSMVQFSFLSS